MDSEFFLLIWAYVNFTAEWFVINCLPELTGRFFYSARNLDCLRGQIWKKIQTFEAIFEVIEKYTLLKA